MASLKRPAWLTLAHVLRVLYAGVAFVIVCALSLLAGIYSYTVYLALKLWVWPGA